MSASRVTVVNRELARTLPRHTVEPRLHVPASWSSVPQAEATGEEGSVDPPRNPSSSLSADAHAAGEVTLEWLEALGCTQRELERARALDIAGFVGMPFPQLEGENCQRVAKFLTLWRLWDDLHVRAGGRGWPFPPELFTGQGASEPPAVSGLGRLERGLWTVIGELARERSPHWLARFCDEMEQWCEAAEFEVEFDGQHREADRFPHFARQLELRTSLSGAYVFACLAEHAEDVEIPDFLYDHPTCRRMQYLAGRIVSLGAALFSLAKDAAEDRSNLVATAMLTREQDLGAALVEVAAVHDGAVVEFDRLAEELDHWAGAQGLGLSSWVAGVRQACLGLILWVAQAPRFAAFALVLDGHRIEPRVELG